jgi:Skp family chaperone for outer membrane proteins
MKRLFLSLFLVLFGFVAPAPAFTAGSVDLKRITTEWPRAKKLADESQAEGKRVQDELRKEFEGYERLVNEGKAMRAELGKPAKDEATKIDRQKKLRDLLTRVAAEEKRLSEAKAAKVGAYQKRYMESAQELLKIIQVKTGEVAKARGIDIVFDSGGSTSHATSVLVYGPKDQDLTEDILKALPQ